MTETGTTIHTNPVGTGQIRPATGGANVSYMPSAIVGRTPVDFETVSFVRTAPGALRAARVWTGGVALADMALKLESAFDARLGDSAISEDGRVEVGRMAAERAKRILKPLPAGGNSPDITAARLALAAAAMELMAVEAAAVAPESIDAATLRATLRRQRPPLPR